MRMCPNCTVANLNAHTNAPSGPWEVGIVAFGLLIVLFTLVAAVKLLFRPGERDPGHIKRSILDDSATPPQGV